jgi:DNA-binding NtrC family response regulator
MPDTDGVTLLKEWAGAGLLNMPVIMMSGHATVDTAVEATRIGAHAFLEKPITMQKLLKAVEQGLNKKAAVSQTAKPTLSATGQVLTHAPAALGPQAVVLPPTHQSFDLELPLRDARDAFERAYFEYHLGKESGSMTRVAEKTGLERTHLYRKLKQLGVDLSKTKRTA